MVVISRHLRAPVVVEERVAERTAEPVAAGLGHDVDDAAAEAAVLGRNAIGRDHRFLDGVLDVKVVGLAAQVLVHVDAVDEVERFKGHRAGNRIAAIRPGWVNTWRLQHHGVDVSCRRQRRHQFLLEVRGDGGCMREDLAVAGPHIDGFSERGRSERGVEGERLAERDGGGLLLTLEAAELERNRISAWRHARDRVVAVVGRDHSERALKIGTGNRHRDAGERQPLAVDDSSRDCSSRCLRCRR